MSQGDRHGVSFAYKGRQYFCKVQIFMARKSALYTKWNRYQSPVPPNDVTPAGSGVLGFMVLLHVTGGQAPCHRGTGTLCQAPCVATTLGVTSCMR